MLDICRQLFDRWNTQVLYCHWKGNETHHLEKGLNGESDLDVLLSIADKEIGHEILQSLQFVECHSQFGSRFPNVEDWIGFDQITGKLVHLHLHFEMVTGHDGLKEYNLPWRNEALESRLFDKATGIYVMNPNLELVTLYTRICLKSKIKQILKAFLKRYSLSTGFKKDPYPEIEYLKARIDWDEIDKILLSYYPEKKREVYKRVLRLSELDSYSFLSIFFINWIVMRKYSRYNLFELLFLLPSYTVLLRLFGWMKTHKKKCLIYKKVINKNSGISIAFLGQDGSGKSTVTNDIIKWLSWKLDSRIFYFGSGDQYETWDKSLCSKIKGNSLLPKVMRRLLTILTDVKWGGYVAKLRKQSSRYTSKGGIAIYDRYPQMQYFGINDGPKIRANLLEKMDLKILSPLVNLLCKREEKFIRRVAMNPPEVVIKLMLSPEESIRRKPFEKYENVKQKHEIIKNLKFEGSSVYDIDATEDYKMELLKIKNIIWNHLLKS